MMFKRPMRAAVVFALMLAASALSVVAVPSHKLADTRPAFDLESAVPKAFGDWELDPRVVPIPPSPDQAAAVSRAYDQIVSRTYVNSRGERVMLTIAYGSHQMQGMRMHRQEVCYESQGFKIARLEGLPLEVAGASISATRLVATQGSRVEPVTYWFTMGDQVVLTYFEREWAQLKYTLSGYIPDGYLVRVSNLSTEADVAFGRHIEFAELLLSHIDGGLRNRLTGRS